MNSLTLLIMAAGVGSRYGGMKQLDGFGPQGQTLLEYSIQDAVKAGFNQAIIVIRPETDRLFKEAILPKIRTFIKTEFVHQSIQTLPQGFNGSKTSRVKPWGTGHAVWVAKNRINTPFAVINADDYYGPDAFSKLAHFLNSHNDTTPSQAALIGYLLKNTLSSHGSVSRGVCQVDKDHYLISIQECTHLKKQEKIEGLNENGQPIQVSDDTLVSMNCWGFYPSFFEALENELINFLQKYSADTSSEFYLPHVANTWLQDGKMRVKVLSTQDVWLGVTYPQDRERVITQLAQL